MSSVSYSDEHKAFAWFKGHEADIIYVNGLTHIYTHTHTHTHIYNAYVDLLSVYICVLQIFVAVICIIIFCDWKYWVLEFHVNNAICLIDDIIIDENTRFYIPCTEYIFHLYLLILEKARAPTLNSVVFFFIISAIVTF